MNERARTLVLAAVACTLTYGLTWAAQVRLPVVADTSLQAHRDELNLNSGASSHIRIKGNEHFMLLKVDLSPIADWRVDRVRLYLHAAQEHKLRTMGISTIAADWHEGSGTSSVAPGGVTFTRAVWPDRFWAGPGSDFLDVALTYGGTIVRYVDIQEVGEGWFALEVDPDLVYAMLRGASYGLCISDEKGQTMANNDVHSREQSGFAPYLVVEGERAEASQPPELGPVWAEPWPAAATFNSGAIRVHVPAGEWWCLFGRYTKGTAADAVDVPRYVLPRVGSADKDRTFVLRGLEPETEYRIEVTATGRLPGPQSSRSCTSRSSPAKPLPSELPPAPEPPQSVLTASEGPLRVWACPAECKVNPISGNVLEEVGREAYGGPPVGEFSDHNPLWDGQTARISGARGEVVALQLVVESREGRSHNLRLRVIPEEGAPAPVGLWRNWYVQDGDWFAEYLIPVADGATSLPATDNGVPGQRNQSFTLIWELPLNAGPRVHRLRVQVADAEVGERAELPILLAVRDFALPTTTTFELSLNCYGEVYQQADWESYLEWERRYFAAAHRLRGTLTPLGYSHFGRVDRAFAPALAGEGEDIRVSDWSLYDRHFGPYLDGSAFTEGVRAGLPISHMYLPLHEGWPTPMDRGYTAGNDSRKYPDNIIAHALTAPAVEVAFTEAFKRAFVAVTRQFVEHFQDRGWTGTNLQCYQNNKYYYKSEEHRFRGISWWLLDEPMHRDDWLALRFFSRLFHEGKGEAAHFIYRGDISRPQWQRDWMDGLMDLMCVSSELFNHPRHCQRMQEEWGTVLWHYGEANPPSTSNLHALAWALRAYCAGADGILPWNVIGGEGALEQPTPTALLIPGRRFGLEGPLVSLRLLALCRGQQDVEYLNLLARKKGYDREQVARLVARSVSLAGQQTQAYAEDAGRLEFSGLGYEDFWQLRERIALALQAE